MSISTSLRDRSGSTPCLCGNKVSLAECCAPIIANLAMANTPEQLMRSRYTAYVLGESAYLLRSWDIAYRPQEIIFDKHIKWLHLRVLDTHQYTGDENRGYVTFTATSICDDTLVEMKEKSKFVKKNGVWFYQDGELTTQKKVIALNAKCPCGSTKKYKRCCRNR